LCQILINLTINKLKSVDFINNPVITGNFNPKFYWTGNPFKDAERINQPHIKAEGENENRIKETYDIINDLSGLSTLTLEDAFNIQNQLLKANNWKGIKAGFRNHNLEIKKADGSFEITPHFMEISELTQKLFPVEKMSKEHLLEWYRQVQMIHPLSDLNGRVFGIIISILN
jgi:hypothetical protein